MSLLVSRIESVEEPGNWGAGELWKGIFTVQSAESQPKCYHRKGGVRAQTECMWWRCPVQGNPSPTDQRTRVTRRICGAQPSLGWIMMPHGQLQSSCVLSLPQDFLTQRRCSCTECENQWPINVLGCYSSHGFPSWCLDHFIVLNISISTWSEELKISHIWNRDLYNWITLLNAWN